jgi:HlyD family secretion protein
VQRGQSLVKIETDKLREQLDDLEFDKPASLVALELAEAELANLKQTTPLKLEAARRTQRNATEDLAYFESIGRASREKGVSFNLKGAEQRLDGAREELNQLKKMYDADDLTEETEEIILKRQKFAVESAEYLLETAKQNGELSLKTTLPREHEGLRTAKRDQDLAAGYAEETVTRTLQKKRLEVEKTKRDQKKAEKRLADLKKDLEEMNVTSPAEGIIYYGACEDGKWTTGAAVGKRLVPGGKLVAREVIMTVVNPDKLILRAAVPEAEVGKLKVGHDGQATPLAAPERKLGVKLDYLGAIPLPGGGFEARLTLGRGNNLRLMPGMTCKVTLEGARQADAVLAPKDAVFSEGTDRFVYLAAKGGAEKRLVKTAGSDDRHVAVEEGLSVGDKILTRKPE